MTSALVLRVDGSERIGLGHIVRCMVLADVLAKTDVKPIFVTQAADPTVVMLLRDSGHMVILLSGKPGSPQDATETIDALRKTSAGGIFVDLSYDIAGIASPAARTYLQTLRKASPMLAALDGLGQTDFDYDLLILPFVGAKTFGLKVHPLTKVLLGPSYFILHPDFCNAAPRIIPPVAQNVLVTMGGSDPSKLTERVLEALALSDNRTNLRVVLGPAFNPTRMNALRALCARLKADCVSGKAMADLMTWADLAVISGGLTKYEAAICGLPSIALSQNSTEAQFTDEFAKIGSLEHLGLGAQIESSHLTQQLIKLGLDDARRRRMSEAGKALMDNKGSDRVAQALAQLMTTREERIVR
jgi:UDP-2,4-diacetamido-2,4,6-trideoxy-beta-L-altropyranose hydrolase